MPDNETTTATDAPSQVTWSKKKRLLFACMLMLFSSLIALVAGEIIIRIGWPQPLLPRYVTDSGFGIRRHSPDVSTWHTTPDYQVAVRTNSMGIRSDREYAKEKADGVIRIIGLGDSYTFGFGVTVEDTFLYRLEKRLQDDGFDIEVINLGVAGSGTAEELIMLRKVALDLDPDYVIVGYYTNDLADNTRAALFELDADGALQTKNAEYLPGVRIRDTLYSFAIYRYLAETSHLMYFARGALSEILQNRLRKANLSTGPSDDAGERRLTAALLDEVFLECERNGVACCILNIPARYNLDGNLPSDLLQQIGADNIVDVYAQIKEAAKSEKMYWTRSDGHWTPRGHEIAAEALADWIRRRLPVQPNAD